MRGTTLFELVLVLALGIFLLLPLGGVIIGFVDGAHHHGELLTAANLARLEQEQLENVDDYLLIDNAFFSNYEGYPYDLRRTVTFQQGDGVSAESVKKIEVALLPAGQSREILKLSSYRTKNVVLGNKTSYGTQEKDFLLGAVDAVIASGVGNTQVGDLTLLNASPSFPITLARLTLSWVPSVSSQRLTEVVMGGVTVWTGSNMSGAVADIADVALAPNTPAALFFRFNADMLNKSFTLNMELADGSIRMLFFGTGVPPTEASLLVVDGTGAVANGTGNIFVRQVYLANTSSTQPITLDRIKLEWTPSTAKLKRITIGGTEVFFKNAGVISGTNNDIANYLLPAAASNVEVVYEFDADMTNNSFTMTTTMSDISLDEEPFITGSPPPTMADLLLVNGSGAAVGGASNELVQQVLLINQSLTTSITLDRIQLSWSPGTQVLRRITIGGTQVFFKQGGVASGTDNNISDYTIPANTTVEAVFEFDTGDMRSHAFTMVSTMTDASQDTQPFTTPNPPPPMKDSYQVDGAIARATGVGNTVVDQVYLKNVSLTQDIMIDRFLLDWFPNAGNLTQITLGGTSVFSGTAADATSIDITDYTIPANSQVEAIFTFDADMLNHSFDLATTFTDASVHTGATFNTGIPPAPMADSFNFDTTTAGFNATGKVLSGTLLQNTSSAVSIVLDQMQVSWTGATGGEKMTQISIGGTTVWTGSVTSGNTVNITDFTLAPTLSYAGVFTFGRDLRGRTFTMRFIFTDASEKTFTFTP
jgi:hypothetical protein